MQSRASYASLAVATISILGSIESVASINRRMTVESSTIKTRTLGFSAMAACEVISSLR